MVCPQCKAITEKGTRCKRHTCVRFPYCFQHLRLIDGLELKDSEIPNSGTGVFATKDFPLKQKDKGSKKPIAYYSAKEITHEPDPFSSYVLQVNKREYLDSKDPSNFTGRYINSFKNHPDTTKRNANVRFTGNQRIYRKDDRYVVPIKQTKAIKKGDELRLNYGNAYPFERQVEI
tara:strand:- start:3534 stop:4058 length:525 start_codon:yes stop_codon:yes gene_type:complete